MRLIQATDFETVKAVYLDIVENTPEIEKHARWVYGKHPTDEALRSHIENGEMYQLMDAESIAGVAVIVMHQGQDYRPVSWLEEFADDQVATLHLLAVCPAYQGKGLGCTIIEKVCEIAGKNGKMALRLDVLKSNLPARRMYERAGFSFRGEQNLYAENTGWIDFLFYEKLLNERAVSHV